jgi:hypothetical protein
MTTTIKQYRYYGGAGPKAAWLERRFNFGQTPDMLVFFLERMQGTVVRINAKVDGIPDAVLSEQRDGKWSVKQNIGHLAEVEEISLKRIDEILNGVPTMSSAVFPVKQDYNAMPVRDVIAFFERNRLATLQAYNTLAASALKLTAIHPRFKVPMNPVDLALFHAEHDDHHLVRMTEIINTTIK